ncbi:hypothetical protein [Cupriavidus sp. CuC1]
MLDRKLLPSMRRRWTCARLVGVFMVLWVVSDAVDWREVWALVRSNL